MGRLATSGVHESAAENERRRGDIASGMKPDTLVIVNPASGGGRALRAETEVASLLAARGYHATFLYTGILQGVVILAVAPFLRHPPQEAATAPRPAAGGAPASLPATARERRSCRQEPPQSGGRRAGSS